MRSAETELQNTIELRATASEIVAPKPGSRRQSGKKNDFEALFKRILRRKITSAKMEEKNAFRARLPSKLHRQLIHQHHLQSHLHCGNDPTVANHNGILSTTHARKTLETPFTMRNRSENDPTTHETVSHPSHRRGRSSAFGDGLCMEKHRVSCICYLSKTHFVRDFLQNSIGNSSTSTTCNPIYIAGTILQLQITMEFCRPHMHEKHLKPHLQCGTDPRMIRPWSDHTRDRLAPVAPQR